MRLTDHSDYSFRVLMYLNQRRSMVTLNELAIKLGISKNNLIKVSNRLAKAGLIDTTRGRTGGLVIKETTSQLTLKDIILKTEERFNMAECFGNKKCGCAFLPTCKFQRSLAEALAAFLNSLGQKTLDDVTPKSLFRP